MVLEFQESDGKRLAGVPRHPVLRSRSIDFGISVPSPCRGLIRNPTPWVARRFSSLVGTQAQLEMHISCGCLYVAKWCKVCLCVRKDFEEGNDDRTPWWPCFFYVFGVLSKLICKGLGHEHRMRLQLSTVRFRCGEHLIQQDPHDTNHENQVVHRCCRRLNVHPLILMDFLYIFMNFQVFAHQVGKTPLVKTLKLPLWKPFCPW